MKGAERVALELRAEQLVAFDIEQPRDAVALQATVRRRAGQAQNRWLQSVEAASEQQGRMTPEGDHDSLVPNRQHR